MKGMIYSEWDKWYAFSDGRYRCGGMFDPKDCRWRPSCRDHTGWSVIIPGEFL